MNVPISDGVPTLDTKDDDPALLSSSVLFPSVSMNGFWPWEIARASHKKNAIAGPAMSAVLSLSQNLEVKAENAFCIFPGSAQAKNAIGDIMSNNHKTTIRTARNAAIITTSVRAMLSSTMASTLAPRSWVSSYVSKSEAGVSRSLVAPSSLSAETKFPPAACLKAFTNVSIRTCEKSIMSPISVLEKLMRTAMSRSRGNTLV